ncbi:MAG: homoserine dehydrogenase [Spirochaetales bacterium]|nr:homoserine dehydrogenase [Spirochaetales bacterium]
MLSNGNNCGIALVGCGTVGSAVAKLLLAEQSFLQSKCAAKLDLRSIVDVDFTKAEQAGLNTSLFETDYEKVIKDQNIRIIVELVGGTTIAKQIIEKALRAHKHVVTANKALLAHHGNELLALARKNGVCIYFEASCAGGIPIIRALYDGLIANRIDALFGIVNGTCNYILTSMTGEGKSYSQALKEAQTKGFAEADPTMDVSGEDSAHKLAILAALAFSQKIDYDSIQLQGIDTLQLCDVEYGQELGYVIKLLAIAKREDDGITLSVKPAFISKAHPLAWVGGPFNAVSVYSHKTGHTMYYGRGAGAEPTASAVVADIIDVAMGTALLKFNNLKLWPDLNSLSHPLPVKECNSRFYIRVMALDKPGVLAKIASVLGKYNISINSVLQKEVANNVQDQKGVPVVITTHVAPEGNVSKALKETDALEVITDRSVCIRIINEHEEYSRQNSW